MTDPIELTVCGARVGHRSGTTDARIPSLLWFDKWISCTVNDCTQLTSRQPPGRALGRLCFRSNGLQPHCQPYRLMTTADEFHPSGFTLRFVVWRGQRTSNDDIIVGIRWELGDPVVDRSVGLLDSDSEKQRPHGQIHGGGCQHNSSPFYDGGAAAGAPEDRQNTSAYCPRNPAQGNERGHQTQQLPGPQSLRTPPNPRVQLGFRWSWSGFGSADGGCGAIRAPSTPYPVNVPIVAPNSVPKYIIVQLGISRSTRVRPLPGQFSIPSMLFLPVYI